MGRAGHERSLRAASLTASFFGRGPDQKLRLAEILPKLDQKITLRVCLGSYHAKVERHSRHRHAGSAEQWLTSVMMQAHVAMADVQLKLANVPPWPTKWFASHGAPRRIIVGGIYCPRPRRTGSLAGPAVYDHYRLGGPGTIPSREISTGCGGALARADKLDSIVGGFHSGSDPRARSDP